MLEDQSPRAAQIVVDRPQEAGFAKTSWGEVARLRVSSDFGGGRLAIVDYRVPAGFGPPRHVHRNDDEIFLVQRGTLVVWTPESCSIAKPGDIVALPKEVPHTWRAYGNDSVRFQVIVSPGELQTFFSDIAAHGLSLSNAEALTEVASDAGRDLLGPPLSDEEVDVIIAGGRVT
jgi:quercetin dioxygenase-like cupin family protein